MSAPLPPARAALVQARQPAPESVLGAGPSASRLPATAVVLAPTRQGALIESAGQRWLMHGAPPLPQGARLALEHVAPGAAPQPARLLAIGGRALAPPLGVKLQPVPSPPSAPPAAESLSGGAGAVQAEARLIGAAGRPLGPPVAVTLTVAPPAPPQATSAMPPAGAAAGPAIASPAASAAKLSASALRGTTTALAPPAAPSPPRPPPQLSAGTAMAPTALAPPAAPSPPQPPPQLPAGTVLRAEVVERDPHGRLLLQSGALRLRLEAPLDLPPGARLTLALPVGLPLPARAMPASATDPMQRLIGALLQQARAGGEAPETGGLRLPAADHALAARLLRWVQTLTAAPSAGAGESVAADGAETVADPVRIATLELARQAREPQPGGWRVVVVPFGVEDPQILKIHLREPEADPERDPPPGRERGDAAQRAVFEVELSHLGRCQVDVLCQAARLDLVVRSAAPLDPAVEAHIRGVIAATRAAGGLAGRLEFRAAELLTLPEPLQPAGRDVVV